MFPSPFMTRWALWLTVASASSRAYLRRIIGLYREEQLVEYPGRMRTVWLEHHLHDTSDWLHYLEIEQELLHNHLYAKPTDPKRHITQITLRLLSSVAYMAALILVYIYAGEAIWLDNQVNKVLLTYSWWWDFLLKWPMSSGSCSGKVQWWQWWLLLCALNEQLNVAPHGLHGSSIL